MKLQDNTILIIDDDIDLVSMLQTFLEMKGLQVLSAQHERNIPQDLSLVNLIILDINMPGNDGFEICKKIREKWNMPILFLTARVNQEDKIKGLMLGGDDYITKPFSLDELYVRIYTNLNREQRHSFKQRKFNLENGICEINGRRIPLTRAEYEIVDLLANYPKQVFSKEKIYDTLWGLDYDGDPQVVSEHIRNIRNKIKNASNQEFIETHWGMGYSWIG